MKPNGILMIEHRLIEKFLVMVGKEIDRIEERLAADESFLKSTVDFIRNYADGIHHGRKGIPAQPGNALVSLLDLMAGSKALLTR